MRIGLASLTLAIISSLFAWYISKENFEESIVSLAYEEAHRLILHQLPQQKNAPTDMQAAAQTLAGGLFDIAEIYDVLGSKMAEAMTSDGEKIEHKIPKHSFLNATEPRYESFILDNDQWVLRVFVPLQSLAKMNDTKDIGYFEGVRIVPAWQEEQIYKNSLVVSLLVSLAALLCGLVVYPLLFACRRTMKRKPSKSLIPISR